MSTIGCCPSMNNQLNAVSYCRLFSWGLNAFFLLSFAGGRGEKLSYLLSAVRFVPPPWVKAFEAGWVLSTPLPVHTRSHHFFCSCNASFTLKTIRVQKKGKILRPNWNHSRDYLFCCCLIKASPSASSVASRVILYMTAVLASYVIISVKGCVFANYAAASGHTTVSHDAASSVHGNLCFKSNKLNWKIS